MSRTLKDMFHYNGGNLKTYAKMVRALDGAVGQVLAVLDEQGIAENIIVIFTSDNDGERFSKTWPFTGQKTELLEGGLRVPTLLRWPARMASQVSPEHCSGTDAPQLPLVRRSGSWARLTAGVGRQGVPLGTFY